MDLVVPSLRDVAQIVKPRWGIVLVAGPLPRVRCATLGYVVQRLRRRCVCADGPGYMMAAPPGPTNRARGVDWSQREHGGKGDCMAEILSSVANYFRKIGPVHLMALGGVGAVLLFAPTSWLSPFGVNELVGEYRSWIGLFVLVVWALLASQFGWWIRGLAANRIQRKRHRKQHEKLLHELTPIEKEYLAPYIHEDLNTRDFSWEDGVAGGLTAKEIIYRASCVTEYGDFPYNLQPWAKRYLTTHPELLSVSSSRTTRPLRGQIQRATDH